MNETIKDKTRLKVMLIAGVLILVAGGVVAYRMQQHTQFIQRLEMSPGELTKSDVPRLIQVLKDSSEGNWPMQPLAARAIGNLGPDAVEAVPALIGKIGYFSDPRIIHGALVSIGATSVPAIIEELRLEPDYQLARVLGVIGPDAAEAVPLLCENVKSTTPLMREEVTWALGQIHANPTVAVPAINSVLNDPEASVRQRAILALSHFEASEQIVAALAKVKDDESRGNQRDAKAVLFLISDEAPDKNIRKAASEAVALFDESTHRG